MKQSLSCFPWPLVFTALGLVPAYWVGYHTTGAIGGAMSFFLYGSILKTMKAKWQHRVLKWRTLIAVCGMRINLFLAVVVLATKIGPISAISLAATKPQEYALIGIFAFGGTFLMMVALSYLVDQSKVVDWIKSVERRLRSLASIRGLEIAVVLLAALMLASALPLGKGAAFLFAAVCGVVTFLAVELVAHFPASEKEVKSAAVKGGIWAFYIRSMTSVLAERISLSEFRYPVHGTFYSVLALSIIMYAQSLLHIPELFTGLIGAALISLSLYTSIRHNNAEQNT